jgi:hypothetical protein
MLRHKGKWFTINPKPYEPERQTIEVSWLQIREGITADKAYRTYFEKQRKDAKILYPSFRKDDN